MTDKFWKDGIKFECQNSSKCCKFRGSYGFLYFNLEDRQRMAKHLGLSTSAFTKKYLDQTEGYYHLKQVEEDCPFLEGHLCSVYEGRPWQCRTWPFWPENLKSLRRWKKDVEGYCPGIGKGRKYSAEEIRKIAHGEDDARM